MSDTLYLFDNLDAGTLKETTIGGWFSESKSRAVREWLARPWSDVSWNPGDRNPLSDVLASIE